MICLYKRRYYEGIISGLILFLFGIILISSFGWVFLLVVIPLFMISVFFVFKEEEVLYNSRSGLFTIKRRFKAESITVEDIDKIVSFNQSVRDSDIYNGAWFQLHNNRKVYLPIGVLSKWDSFLEIFCFHITGTIVVNELIDRDMF